MSAHSKSFYNWLVHKYIVKRGHTNADVLSWKSGVLFMNSEMQFKYTRYSIIKARQPYKSITTMAMELPKLPQTTITQS